MTVYQIARKIKIILEENNWKKSNDWSNPGVVMKAFCFSNWTDKNVAVENLPPLKNRDARSGKDVKSCQSNNIYGGLAVSECEK